jgi:HAE1 family hydrophobic/amphiphilic exporter-1
MAKFFINRPIVAIVISIIFVIRGHRGDCWACPSPSIPISCRRKLSSTRPTSGADAQTVEQSVATPIEQEMSGVDNMNYMYSLNANNGEMKLYVNFDVKTDPNIDQVLTQMRKAQADSKLPAEVRDYGITVKKSTSSPLMLVALSSRQGQLRRHLPGQLRLHQPERPVHARAGHRQRHRLRRRPVRHAHVGQARPAGQAQHHGGRRSWTPSRSRTRSTRPARWGRAGAARHRVHLRHPRPGPPGDPEEFEKIVVRANPDGSMVRLKDVARIELGSQTYANVGPAERQALGRPRPLPAARHQRHRGRGRREKAHGRGQKTSFPPDLEYTIPLDTTQSVREGIKEILQNAFEALILVIIVVFIFLQGWRATLIPALAVPVSLVGTFALFPLLGFSINTIALMGLVLAIGLVVDDAIVVVEAVEHHIEHGLTPKEATLKAMEEVSGPVIAIALVLSAVFLPTVFIPGITGKLYQQFAVTIAISVIISAFNALTLSPASARLILKPKKQARGPLGAFYRWFNNVFGRATNGYVKLCGFFIRKFVISLILLAVMTGAIGVLGKAGCPAASCPRRTRVICMPAFSCPTPLRCSAPTPPAREPRRSSWRRPGAVLHHRRGLQHAVRRHQHLQRVLLHHAQTLARAQEPRRAVRGHHGRPQPAHEPAAPGGGLRLLAAGHPGHRHLRRRHLPAGRPGRQGYRLPVGPHPEVPGRGEEAARDRPGDTTFLPTVPQSSWTWTATRCSSRGSI